MTDVVKLSFFSIALYLIGYIILHLLIMMSYKKEEEKLQKNPNDISMIKNVKALKLLSKWFPAIYVIFILISLYY